MQKLTTKAHYDNFKDKAQVYSNLWQDDKFLGHTKEQWIELFKQDPHLNQTGNYVFDRYFPIFNSVGIRSLADNICALKHYIIYSVIEAEPKFLPEK